MLVLTFHRVETMTGLEITHQSPARFERLLRMIEDSGRVPARPNGKSLDGGDVLITFDDGFASVAENALPLIQRRGWTALVFLIVDAVGKADDWDARLLGRSRPMMSWEQVEYWSEHGIAFGSHTLTHPDLTALSQSALRRELFESKSRLEDRIGLPVRYFSYPFGRMNARVREAVIDAGYEAAFGAQPSRCDGIDPFAIPRVNVHALMSLFQFRSLLQRTRRDGTVRTRLFTSLNAGSAVVINRRRLRRIAAEHPVAPQTIPAAQV